MRSIYAKRYEEIFSFNKARTHAHTSISNSFLMFIFSWLFNVAWFVFILARRNLSFCQLNLLWVKTRSPFDFFFYERKCMNAHMKRKRREKKKNSLEYLLMQKKMKNINFACPILTLTDTKRRISISVYEKKNDQPISKMFLLCICFCVLSLFISFEFIKNKS